DLVNATDQASVNTLNAGLTPQSVGESHVFSVLDVGAITPRTVTLISADVTVTPVQNVHTITTPGGSLVGYMLFNDHLATAEGELVKAFTQLQTAGITDLVLDIRYNGGGYLDIASEVAYMIAGPSRTSGQTFELTKFNSKHPTVDPVTGATITPLGFHATTQGLSTTSGQPLPTVNLARVFVLTGPSTCSASESIINSLRGVNVQVIQVGSTTCGKPYGFYPTDNCGVTYFSIQFQGVNAMGFGDYPDGFTPSNTVTAQGVSVPGCSVADDFTHALGDSAEGLLASALGYQANGVCPAAPSGSAPPPMLAVGAHEVSLGGQAIKSLWQQNRIQRRSTAQ
ncbi:MAG TPA: S41 family peptidase, partial [Steroidobacteraceae bacterium]|nr:S41 family peptidase [Steroidobacteraceae bacterium]